MLTEAEEISLRTRLTQAEAMMDAAYMSLGKTTLLAEQQREAEAIARQRMRQEIEQSAALFAALLGLCKASRETATMSGWISTDAVEELLEHRLP